MSIKLRFEKGSLSTQVVLKDDALPELMKIVSEYQSDETPAAADIKAISEIGATVSDLQNPSKDEDRLPVARTWLRAHSASEILSRIGWQTFPEKILLLGALHEASGKGEGWRSADIEATFKSAREQPPGNFARDISTAIKAGIVATVTPRTYKVSRTGWMKIYEAIIKAQIEKE